MSNNHSENFDSEPKAMTKNSYSEGFEPEVEACNFFPNVSEHN
jgi:hypothetical protein